MLRESYYTPWISVGEITYPCSKLDADPPYSWAPFTDMDTLMPEWIGNHMSSKVSDEINFPLPNFNNSCTVEVWKWISNLSHILLDM